MELLQKMVARFTVAVLGVEARMRLEREEGQAMVEYGLIIALIAVVLITVVALLGTNISKTFSSIANKL
jgi:pilus assembly protein Flp/PilA